MRRGQGAWIPPSRRATQAARSIALRARRQSATRDLQSIVWELVSTTFELLEMSVLSLVFMMTTKRGLYYDFYYR